MSPYFLLCRTLIVIPPILSGGANENCNGLDPFASNIIKASEASSRILIPYLLFSILKKYKET